MSMPLQSGWTEYSDPASGRTYYCHQESGKTQWQRPIDVEKSQNQDATLNLTHSKVPKNQESALQGFDGSERLAQSHPSTEPTTTEKQLANQLEAQSLDQRAKPSTVMDDCVPRVKETTTKWRQFYDSSSQRYYYQSLDSQTVTWDRPPTQEIINAAPPPVPTPRSGTSGGFGHSRSQSAAAAITPSTMSMSISHSTPPTSTGLSSSHQQPARMHTLSASTQKDSSISETDQLPALAAGWKQFYDATQQRHYYYNATSNRTTWNRDEATKDLSPVPLYPSTPPPTPPPRAFTHRATRSVDHRLELPQAFESSPQRRNTEFTLASTPVSTPTSASKERSFSISASSPKSPQKDSRRKSHAYFSGLFHSSTKAPKKAKQQLFADIHRFQETDFARKHFANCRRGFFKRKLPMKEFLVWSKEPLDHPLLTDVRGIDKYAHKISKDILKFMGDHKTQHQDQHGMDVLVLGRRHAETRDEIILQLCKQVTDNPENESCLRGWGLLGLCLFSFTPTVDLEPHLKTIFEVYENHSSEAISSFARYCIARLGRPTHRETRQVTFEELRTCHEAIYKANPFNCTIDELILLEKKVPGAPDAIPSFLVELVENLKACGGMEAEGVFRIAPDSDDFETLKLGVIKGEVQLSTIEDPHMLAGLMKQFLRELVVPVVPFANYMSCATARSNPTRCKEAFDALPPSHQVVLRYILGFIRELSQPIYQQQTKMDSRSLSLVLAPNILRCPSLDPMEVFARSQDETDFIVTLVNTGI